MIDLSQPKRRYYSDSCGLKNCPECGTELLKEYCSILLYVESKTEEKECMTSKSGSHFCIQCPVVVFDSNELEEVAKIIMQNDKNLQYGVLGILNLAAIPKDKKHLAIGSDENPMPLVDFLPGLNKGL